MLGAFQVWRGERARWEDGEEPEGDLEDDEAGDEPVSVSLEVIVWLMGGKG